MRENHLIVLRVRIVRTQEANSFSPTHVKGKCGRRRGRSRKFLCELQTDGRTSLFSSSSHPLDRLVFGTAPMHVVLLTSSHADSACFWSPRRRHSSSSSSRSTQRERVLPLPPFLRGKIRGVGPGMQRKKKGRGKTLTGDAPFLLLLLPGTAVAKFTSQGYRILNSHRRKPNREKKHSPVSKSVE